MIFIFWVFFNKLHQDNTYVPKKVEGKIENILIKDFYSEKNFYLRNLFSDEQFVLINIWASWCIPCREEHEFISKLSKIKNLKIIGINYKDKKNNALKFLNQLGNPYDVILDDTDGTKSIFLGAYGVPETLLVDKKLSILKKYIGPINSKNSTEIKNLIK